MVALRGFNDGLPFLLKMAQDQADAAKAAADTAQSGVTNTRDMIIRRDPTLNTAAAQASDASAKYTTLAGLAADYQTALSASLTDRQALHDQLTALLARVTALEGKGVTVQRQRVTTTQVLALGGSVDLTVTWPTPFADAAYDVIPLFDASTGLTTGVTIGVKSQTKTAAVVTVKTSVAVAAGLALNVLGLRFG